MTYTNGAPGYIWLGVSYPEIPATLNYCDSCAHAGAVPFEVRPCRNPACKYENTGGTVRGRPPENSACEGCSSPYRVHQARPWKWCPVGWDKRLDATPCDGCGKPCASGRAFYYDEKEPA